MAEIERMKMAGSSQSEQFRNRLYEAYSSTQAGTADGRSQALAFRRDILPHLPTDIDAGVIDLGCGQGALVSQLLARGYSKARGVDVSPEQVELAHKSGVSEVFEGDYREVFGRSNFDAVIGTDFFEHLTKYEVLQALDYTYSALRPRGLLIMRVPNAVSPFGGNYRYGDFTHETSFTGRSIRQLGVAAGFRSVRVYPCPPLVHGGKSLARRVVWTMTSGAMKLILAAETGVGSGHLVTQNIVAVMRKE
jgi:2-polyprenyl-3-methyl-5-hydroxy-6-metoxy-1,4-benzoquinol methylase